MKWRILLGIFGLVFSTVHAWGATIYVDGTLPSTGPIPVVTYNPSTRSATGGLDVAYRTLTAANAAVVPGTTVIIRAGSYEQLRPVSGAAGLVVTYRAYPGETVRVGSGSTSSHGMDISGRRYVEIDGLRVEDRYWCEGRDSHHITLRNCVFLRKPGGGTSGNVRIISSTYFNLLNCQLIQGNDNFILIDSQFCLVEGCTLGDGGHSVMSIRCSDYNIFRNNYMYNPRQKIAEIYDCGEDTTALDPHSFDSTRHNVFEGNIFAGCILGIGSEYTDTTSNGNGMQWAAQNGIMRRNIFTDCNVGIGLQYYGDEAINNKNSRFYHNVFYKNKGPGVATRVGNRDNKLKNNIFLQNGGCINGCFNAITPGQIVYRDPSSSGPFGPGTSFEKNVIRHESTGQTVMERDFASSGQTLAQFNAQYPGFLIDTLDVDPQFESPTTNQPSLANFALKSTSPLIDAGTFLTKAASAGSGFTLTVLDSINFHDGFGIPGEVGDLIQLQGQSQQARILDIDYATHTLTLDQSLTWTNGQGVSLAYSGAAPDVGAVERVVASGVQLSFNLTGPTFGMTWPADGSYELLSSTNIASGFGVVATPDGSYSESVTNAAAKFFFLRKKN